MKQDELTILVYREREGSLLHQPGPNPGTPYTACGLDAGLMVREDRPMAWAGMWCTACLRTIRGNRDG